MVSVAAVSVKFEAVKLVAVVVKNALVTRSSAAHPVLLYAVIV